MSQRLGLLAVVAVIASAMSSVEAAAWCVRGVQTGDTLRMRQGPGVRNPLVGRIPPRACGVTVVGPCRGAWCRVSWRGRVGWANAEYLARATGRDIPDRRSAARTDLPRAAPAPRPPAVERDIEPPPGRAPHTIARDIGMTPGAPDRQEPSHTPAPAAVSPPLASGTPQPPEPRQLASSEREACVKGVAAGDTLKVRAGPGVDQALRFGFLPGTCSVRITGGCAAGWCPVDYRGYQGWAEERFLE